MWRDNLITFHWLLRCNFGPVHWLLVLVTIDPFLYQPSKQSFTITYNVLTVSVSCLVWLPAQVAGRPSILLYCKVLIIK